MHLKDSTNVPLLFSETVVFLHRMLCKYFSLSNEWGFLGRPQAPPNQLLLRNMMSLSRENTSHCNFSTRSRPCRFAMVYFILLSKAWRVKYWLACSVLTHSIWAATRLCFVLFYLFFVIFLPAIRTKADHEFDSCLLSQLSPVHPTVKVTDVTNVI